MKEHVVTVKQKCLTSQQNSGFCFVVKQSYIVCDTCSL